MAKNILIADCGSTKSTWCIIANGKKKTITTLGISPYFLNKAQIVELISKEVAKKIKIIIDEIYYYGTGCSNPENTLMLKNALKECFGKKTLVEVNHDLTGAARALCQRGKGIACILGTGSNSCFYNGKKITKNSPGLGYILGDEGSGAYLGRKVIQYYLYKTFDAELEERFKAMFGDLTAPEILDAVYKQPLANRYLAKFNNFLVENRGHYMVDNIIEDGINDFFFTHLCKYAESWSLPIHFIGSVANGYKEVILDLASSYEFEIGTVLKSPMEGLIKYHTTPKKK